MVRVLERFMVVEYRDGSAIIIDKRYDNMIDTADSSDEDNVLSHRLLRLGGCAVQFGGDVFNFCKTF